MNSQKISEVLLLRMFLWIQITEKFMARAEGSELRSFTSVRLLTVWIESFSAQLVAKPVRQQRKWDLKVLEHGISLGKPRSSFLCDVCQLFFWGGDNCCLFFSTED